MRVLYAASRARHIKDFHLPIISGLIKQGFDVTVMCRDSGELTGQFQKLEVPFAKSFFSMANIKSLLFIYRLLKKESYDIISTHTALAGFVVRCAYMLTFKKSAVCVHTAHGYLFSKNARLSGWLTYPFEKICAPITDIIIVMNREDYGYAGKLVRKGGRVVQSTGMGVDLNRYKPCEPKEKSVLRNELRLPDGFLIFCAAEFSRRKNHKALIQAMPEIIKVISGAYFIFAGDGVTQEEIKALAVKLGVDKRIVFLGYVADTSPFLRASDMAISASHSEGLAINILEALAAGIPVAASRVKGHIELLEDGAGLLFDSASAEEISGCCCEIFRGKNMKKPNKDFLISKDTAAMNYLSIYTKNLFLK